MEEEEKKKKKPTIQYKLNWQALFVIYSHFLKNILTKIIASHRTSNHIDAAIPCI